MFLLIKSNILKYEYLKKAINLTFYNRDTLISLIPNFLPEVMNKFQKQWEKHLINVDEDVKENLPENFSFLISEINYYLSNII